MHTVPEYLLKPCKCGGKGRYRYHVPAHYVECRNKSCPYHMRTSYYPDLHEEDDPEQKQRAVDEWNRMVENG